MDLDENGVDRAGNPDFLTLDEPSPAGAFAYNTAWSTSARPISPTARLGPARHRALQRVPPRLLSNWQARDERSTLWLTRRHPQAQAEAKAAGARRPGPPRRGTTYEPVKPAKQLGFVHNNVDCIGCRACEIACKDKNGLAPGPRFRRVMYVEGGSFPMCLPTRSTCRATTAPNRPACRPARPARSGSAPTTASSTSIPRCASAAAAARPPAPMARRSSTRRQPGQEVQPVRRRDRGRPQALLRDGLHDARARHRPHRQLRAGTYEHQGGQGRQARGGQVQHMADPN
jgi:NAD-dependent dihydropyrimidine dehydrogenase PreA subunit